ncbi:hypothetical protein GCM10020001_007330 [Nonomuraea salmonea]
MVVDAAHQHGVDLDGAQPGGVGGGQARDDVGVPVAVGEPLERAGVEGVERDVDPVEPGGGQRLGQAGQPDAVAGQRDLRAGG